MPVVNFEGKEHQFPDDFTEQDISKALASMGENKPAVIADTPEMVEAEAATLGAKAGAQAMSVNFNDAVTYALGNEGGLVNDPSDSGGETNFGISKKSYPNENIKEMTKERATAIYRKDFWDKPKLGKLPDRLATKVFDSCVNTGNVRCILLLQKQLGVDTTGVINDATVKAVEALDEEVVIKGYIKVLKDYYKEVAKVGKNSRFLKGWLARAERMPEVVEVKQ